MILLCRTILIVVVLGCAVGAQAADDDTIRAKIAQVRAAAFRVQIDGRGDDWVDMPTLSDPQRLRTGNASMDIESVGVAPLDSELLIMIRTRRRPMQLDHLYRFNLDYRGDANADIQIGLSLKGTHAVWPNHDKKDPRYVFMRGVPAKVGDVIEATITYEDLARVLPDDKAADLMGAAARGWVRVRPFTMRLRGTRVVDWGPAAASYRLTANPPPLDEPMPMRFDGEPYAIDVPGEGQWYVSQGANGAFTHRGTWAYDLIRVDQTLSPSKLDAKKKENHYVWNAPVLSPLAGKVSRVRDDGIDHEPYAKDMGRSNTVVIEGGGAVVVFYHLRQGSAKVKPGDNVEVGTPLARVGNSGGTNYPHLHLHVQVGTGRGGVPLAFRDVRVSLNPGDCPWARDLAAWSPREGMLVESLKGQ